MTFRAFAAAGLLMASSLLLVPAASQAQILMTQKDVEAELRVQWMSMKREMPQHPSPRIQQFAQCIAYAILDVIPDEFDDLNWEVIVFDDDSKNAMVTPAGKIAIFSGLLEVANTPDRLAAVLGHEVAHLTEDHVKERVRRAVGTGLFGAIGGAVTGMQSQEAAQVVFQLPFQREQENEADLVGMQYAARAGYNPAAALELWREMGGSGNQRGQRPPEFLSTHPDPEFRMQDIARNLSPSLKLYHDTLDSGVRPRCQP
jgi:predicted Zn-dependent protease